MQCHSARGLTKIQFLRGYMLHLLAICFQLIIFYFPSVWDCGLENPSGNKINDWMIWFKEIFKVVAFDKVIFNQNIFSQVTFNHTPLTVVSAEWKGWKKQLTVVARNP